MKHLIIVIIALLLITGCSRTIDRTNDNIPPNFKYTSKEEYVPEEFHLAGPFTIHETYEDDIIYKDEWDFYCKYNSKKAEEVEFYYYSNPRLAGAFGGRKALICEDVYYIFDRRAAYGGGLFGPFDINNT
ncbi:hypothetical protein KY328_01435 [Candidatus Woesearchaeota archaeon]|nr:hypothetical protein [Candidatus Woesearchaeota archaeon]MBW3021559.1 hypothetical protein [Candidatus Woesearchaeota archaeon]